MVLDGTVKLARDLEIVQDTAVKAPMPKSRSLVIERLHALVRKGYKAELGTKVDSDFVVLRHLGRTPDLVLHEDGTLEGLDGRRPRYKRHIDPPAIIGGRSDADQLRFMKFIETIPRATLFDRTRPWRVKYVYIPLALVAVWGLCLSFTAIIMNS